MTFLTGKKGQAFIWLGVIILIFVMGLFYILLDHTTQDVKETFEGNITGSIYEDDYKKIDMAWDYFLIIFLFFIMIFGVLAAMRKRDETY